jgi:hypothetical protein
MKYIKTELGQQAFKERSPLFSARQRSTFIQFDGIKTVEQVLVSTAGLGVTQVDVDHMVAQGFLAPVDGQAATIAAAVTPPAAVVAPLTGTVQVAAPLASAQAVRTDMSDQDRYKEAKPLATQLTAALGLRGFMLNLSVESASGFDELLVLFPKIQTAVGSKACRELERALKG